MRGSLPLQRRPGDGSRCSGRRGLTASSDASEGGRRCYRRRCGALRVPWFDGEGVEDAVLAGGGHGGRGRTRWPVMRAHDEVDLDARE